LSTTHSIIGWNLLEITNAHKGRLMHGCQTRDNT